MSDPAAAIDTVSFRASGWHASQCWMSLNMGVSNDLGQAEKARAQSDFRPLRGIHFDGKTHPASFNEQLNRSAACHEAVRVADRQHRGARSLLEQRADPAIVAAADEKQLARTHGGVGGEPHDAN